MERGHGEYRTNTDMTRTMTTARAHEPNITTPYEDLDADFLPLRLPERFLVPFLDDERLVLRLPERLVPFLLVERDRLRVPDVFFLPPAALRFFVLLLRLRFLAPPAEVDPDDAFFLRPPVVPLAAFLAAD